MSKRTGFTLIELLVVIAIIALLLSIIVPALKEVKKAGKVIVCKSNLRQLTMGMRLYAEANNGKAPAFVHDPGDYWYFDIAPYLGSDKPSAKHTNLYLTMVYGHCFLAISSVSVIM